MLHRSLSNNVLGFLKGKVKETTRNHPPVRTDFKDVQNRDDKQMV